MSVPLSESCKYACTGFETLASLAGLIKRKEEEEEYNEVYRQAEESEASGTETRRQCRENEAFEQAAGSVVFDRVSTRTADHTVGSPT